MGYYENCRKASNTLLSLVKTSGYEGADIKKLEYIMLVKYGFGRRKLLSMLESMVAAGFVVIDYTNDIVYPTKELLKPKEEVKKNNSLEVDSE